MTKLKCDLFRWFSQMNILNQFVSSHRFLVVI